MPRPRSLTSADITAAALAVIDREGLAALSMRIVAAELGVGAMSLYRYVEDRQALELLVVDQVLGAVDTRPLTHASWEEQITRLAEGVREAVNEHPSCVPLLLLHRHASKAARCWTEALLRALEDGGFAGEKRVIAVRTLVSYINGALQAQNLGPLKGQGTEVMAALPEDEYPLLAATARIARGIEPGTEFRDGLAVVVRGLRSLRS
ncbi:TetR/AcrR family transcriptional regulator [Bordetella genomosp. 11]|uniref:TetR family transcriptional regulator n=1 Tax=Bordetella genomosp. 11 TaxID=1416808 RepID=A0A261UJ74_9BORD|nr:TetR/AcrR family transcriptional regulator [Bordetella genomosp. 11]OZI61597.1 TetR family transcriptional regulator [Bordetella genomosp. 11]